MPKWGKQVWLGMYFILFFLIALFHILKGKIHKHKLFLRAGISVCCDLLSNCIFNEFYHSPMQEHLRRTLVVICFQIVSLTSSITASQIKELIDQKL